MKYLVRSIKYFVFLCLFLTVIIVAMIALGFVGTDITEIFKNGYDSLWQMALMLAVLAAVYPRFGYGERKLSAPGPDDEVRPKLQQYMNGRGYVLVSEDKDGNLVYRKASILGRISRFFEDKICFSRVLEGYVMEGPLKDVVRLDTGLTRVFQPGEE